MALTFGNCVLKTGVIEWPLKLCVRFLRFFSKYKNMTFYVSGVVAHVFSNTGSCLINWGTGRSRRTAKLADGNTNTPEWDAVSRRSQSSVSRPSCAALPRAEGI